METNLSDERILFLKNTRLISTLLVVCFLLAGIAVRLIDLSDPPLDFAATRQLHSLVMALLSLQTRGIHVLGRRRNRLQPWKLPVRLDLK